jgi:hypothetical protein
LLTKKLLLQENQPEIEKTRLAWSRELLVTVFFLGLALVFTWPLALHWREAIPGDGRDGWQMVWNLWWVRYALEHGQNPFQTDLLFYPQGTGLYLHALNALNGFLSLPVQYLTGSAIPGYNFIVLFSLTFSAYGAFCLARYLWGSTLAALLAGVAFGFSSYHFAHLLGHLNLISSEFIPFYILFLLQATNRKQYWKRPALLAVLMLLCGMLLELQYILYLAIFSAFYLLYLVGFEIFYRWRKLASPRPGLPGTLGRATLIAGLFLLLSLPFTIPMLNEALTNPNTVPAREDSIYSADALAYLYPSPFHPLWGSAMKDVIRPWTATLIEKVVFPGYTVYLLILLSFVFWLIRRLSPRTISDNPAQSSALSTQHSDSSNPTQSSVLSPQSREWKPGATFWLLVALVFIVLSFGRRLHINGVEHGPTLPAALIYKLPLLNITRVPSRYAVIALLSLGLIASKTLADLRFQIYDLRFTKKVAKTGDSEGNSYSNPNRKSEIVNLKSVLVCLAVAALIFELWPAPYQLAYYNVPEFYKNLAADNGRYAILDIPMNVGRDYQYTSDYLEAQMEHHKPLLGGYISRNPVYPPFYGVPVFWEFSQFQPAPRPDILPTLSLDDQRAILDYFGVRYLVVHKDLVRGTRQEAVLSLAYKLFPQGPIYDKENLVVFEVPPGQSKPLHFANLVQPTWYETEKGGDGHYSRWAQGQQAGIDLWSDRARTVEINVPAWSFNEPHPVEFVLNGQSLAQHEIGQEPQVAQLKLELKPGRNRLDLKIGGKVNRPSDLGPGNDTRELTIAVGEIKINWGE